LSAVAPTRAVLRSGGEAVAVALGREPAWHELTLGGAPVEVVNNVGTEPAQHGYWRDRGWLEVDTGQYDVPTDVPAWCGGAVLLASRYLDDVGLFDERLFLYYEDVELSLRGAGRWRYRYVPASVVRHLHSASAVEGSDFSRYHNERNRLLVLARHGTGWALVAAAARYLLATLSYARRDVLAPLARRRRTTPGVVVIRARAFSGFLRLLPGTLCDRWADRSSVR
jgi:GT2 family glycosyltransferase